MSKVQESFTSFGRNQVELDSNGDLIPNDTSKRDEISHVLSTNFLNNDSSNQRKTPSN